MKKISSFILAAAILGLTPIADATPLKEYKPETISRSTDRHKLIEDFRRVEKKDGQKLTKKPMMEPSSVDNIIHEIDGKPVYYYKTATGYDYGSAYELSDFATCIVYGENNDVYFYNILSLYSFNTFAKGTIEGNTITMQLPQAIVYLPNYDMEFDITVLKYDYEEQMYFPADIDEITFTVDPETGEIEMNLPGEEGEYILGYVDSLYNEWSYDGDVVQKYTPIPQEATSVPEGVETETYYFVEDNYGYPVEVGFDSEYLYIKGFSLDLLPYNTLRAKLNGNTADVVWDDFIGIYSGYQIYTEPAILNPDIDIDDYDSPLMVLAPSTSKFTLDIDLENKVIKTSESNDVYLLLNASLTEVLYLTGYTEFSMKTQDDFAGTPRNPYNLIVLDDYYELYGYHSFIFNLPNIATNGNVMKSADLYYNIYIDNMLWDFEEDYDNGWYIGLGGPTFDIPSLLNNNNDIYIYNMLMHEIGIYIEGATTYGVQSVYRYQGEETRSDIITINLENGVKSVSEAGGVETKTEYYDLNGRKVNNPANGIFIRRAVMNDGSVKVSKVIKK